MNTAMPGPQQTHVEIELLMGIDRISRIRCKDTLAEWLRRRPAEPMGSPRVGSNPTGVASIL